MRIPGGCAMVAMAALLAALSACRYEQPAGLPPNLLRVLVMPSPGQRDSAVVALNGEPDRREQVQERELWVYSRAVPEGVALRRTTAAVWFRDGIVVDVDVGTSTFTPTPTIPGPAYLRSAEGALR